MLAARLNVSTRTFGVVDVPVPEPAAGQVRIRVESAGVCLSDVHLIDGHIAPSSLSGESVTLGHEVAGVVDALGEGVDDRHVGERVLLHAGEQRPDGAIAIRGIDYDGGWAEYALATASTVIPIPDALSFDEAAIVPDAVSTPWAAITSTAGVRAAQPVAVWGVGGLGAHAVQLLRIVGAAPVIAVDPLPKARERALAFGADLALDPAAADFAERMLHETGAGVAVAFDFAGVPAAQEQAAASLGPRGKLVLVGLSGAPLTIDPNRLTFLHQQLLGHLGSGQEHVEELVALAGQGRLDLSRSISGVLPLADAERAVEQLQSKTTNPVRLILKPPTAAR